MQRRSRRPPSRSRLVRILGGGSAAALLTAAALSATPWPSALLIRRVFESGARALVNEMEPYVDRARVDDLIGVELPGTDSRADVFRPRNSSGPRPTIIWVHGGAWISGSRADVAPYLRILASHGYTTVGLDYPVAPASTYPSAIVGLNDALAALLRATESYGIDADRIILAGDSAGAQLASQLATLVTSEDYARTLGITPALSPDQLIGSILHCGVYNLDSMAELTGITAWGFKTALWAYTGRKNWVDTPAGTTMSTIEFVTGSYPPTLISGGNGDSLTAIQSVPMAGTLASLGVDVTPLFWPDAHRPALPHEYQFHLDLPEAQAALAETLAFLGRITR